MLWLGLLERDSGTRASRILEVKDAVDAMAFDLAVSLRLMQFDNEKEDGKRKFLARLLGCEVDD